MNSKSLWQRKNQNLKPRKRQTFRKFWQHLNLRQIAPIAWHIRNWNLSGSIEDLLD
jgi:hypothetical protein